MHWVDGWPQPEPVLLNPRPDVVVEVFDFADPEAGPTALNDHGWLSPRRAPTSVARVEGGRLVVESSDDDLGGLRPAFVGRRQQHLTSRIAVTVDASNGTGGLALRYDENLYLALQAHGRVVTAVAALSSLRQTWTAVLPEGTITLSVETALPPVGFSAGAAGADRIRLIAEAGGTRVQLAEVDGRFWTAESAGGSFTGRVTGAFADSGVVTFGAFTYRGSEQPA